MDIIENMIRDEINLSEDQEETWKITDDKTADWWIELKNEELKKEEHLKSQLEEKLEFYQHQLDKVNKKINNIKEHRDSKLLEYFENVDDDLKHKTKTQEKYKLPSGELIVKYRQPKIKRNDDKLKNWVRVNKLEQYIEKKETVKWGEMKKDLKDRLHYSSGDHVIDKETGEIVEGLKLEHRSPVFEVK